MSLELAKENFKKYIKQNSYRNTPERYEILELIYSDDGHFDADELYLKLKMNNSKISRATVYNTLDILQECGIISRYRFGENHSRYEKAFGRPHHDHLICLECGDIIEFIDERISKIENSVCKENNFKQTSATLQIFGICHKCQIKK